LQVVLTAKGKEIEVVEATLCEADQTANQQEAIWRSTMREVLSLYNSIDATVMLGTDDED
jgi:hypothetical protein